MEKLPFRLILASASPARRFLLSRAGYQFDVMPANIEEPSGAGFSDPRSLVAHIAWLKAAAIALGEPGASATGGGAASQEREARSEERKAESGKRGAATEEQRDSDRSPLPAPRSTLILAADTLGWLNGQVIGKPADEADARRIINTLAGTTHELWTGVCLWLLPDQLQITFQEVSRVAMSRLSEPELAAYIAGGNWRGASGAYAIQEDGNDPLVRVVEGTISNVIGLPMETLERVFERLKEDRA